MLQQVGLLVRPPPLHMQHVRNQALRQPVTPHHLLRPAYTLRRQVDDLARVHLNQPIPLQPLQHPRHRRRRDIQPVRQAHRDHILPLIMVEPVDGREVIIAGNVGNLFWHIPANLPTPDPG